MKLPPLLRPDWPALPGVFAGMSLRAGGVSVAAAPATLSLPANAAGYSPVNGNITLKSAAGLGAAWLATQSGTVFGGVPSVVRDMARPFAPMAPHFAPKAKRVILSGIGANAIPTRSVGR